MVSLWYVCSRYITTDDTPIDTDVDSEYTPDFLRLGSTKVEEQSHPQSGCLQVVEQLRLIAGTECRYRFVLNKDFFFYNQVRSEPPLENGVLILYIQFDLPLKANVQRFQFIT